MKNSTGNEVKKSMITGKNDKTKKKHVEEKRYARKDKNNSRK